MLSPAIRILSAKEEKPSFHARFSATAKTYIYSIYNGDILPPQERLYTVHVRQELDIKSMKGCLNLLKGTHDFGCFEAAGSRSPETIARVGSIRTITEANITYDKTNYIIFDITGDGFLRHMVRNIVGTVLEVGLKRRSLESFGAVLQSKNRSEAGPTAPAHGLTLKKIYY